MTFWWEEANWPAAKEKERGFSFFEDIRKLLTLIEHPSMGQIDIYRLYGKKVDSTYVPYDSSNWAGSWTGFAPPNPAHPGEVLIIYKDATEMEDIYVNFVEMTETDLNNHPPIKGDGMLDTTYWKLGVNPNLYCHYNNNAGKPGIGADGRYIVVYHAEHDEECEYPAYTSILKAHKWLPRHTHPYRQIAPLDFGPSVKQRRDPQLFGVETKDAYITQSIGTEWDRSSDTEEHCTKPNRFSEYVLEGGEPEGPGSTCEASGQCAEDPKMCEAYQDRVIYTIEQYGLMYLKAVDAAFITEFLYQEAIAWDCTGWGGNGWWYEGQIVHKGTKTISSTFWVCIESHAVTAPDDCKEPGTEEGEGYWTTPAYHPELFIDHPVYGYLGHYGWRCCCSAFELTLREINSYDWWWDTEHPFVSWFLYGKNKDTPADWPLPRGCWRRTWKHSMGRVGTTMWPQEGGNPPGYKPRHFIVSQAVYDTIPEANQEYYAVSDVEGLYDAAYGDEEEALIAKRHDPVMIDSGESHYEIHHDLVNDIWEVLLQLDLINWDVSKRYQTRHGAYSGEPGGPWLTSLGAYTVIRGVAEADREWAAATGWGVEFADTFSYGACVWSSVEQEEPPYLIFWSEWADIHDGFNLILRVPVADGLPGIMPGQLLQRVQYTKDKAVANTRDHWTECTFGFGDKTITATPAETTVWEWIYVTLEFWDMDDSAEDYYYFAYDGYVLSPWPLTGEGKWMDFSDYEIHRHAGSEISILMASADNEAEHQTIFEMDWNLVPESVFEEDDSNAIEM